MSHDAGAVDVQPPRFGPVSDFGEGLTELDVPRRVFILVDGDEVSAFDRTDPNNGCLLSALDGDTRVELGIDDEQARYAEPCHGNHYDVSGRPLHCAARSMRAIDVDVVDGIAQWGGVAVDAEAPAPRSRAECPDSTDD